MATSSVSSTPISFGGLATGLPANMVDQLMTVETRRMTALQTKKSNLTTQQTALNDLGTKLAALDTTVTNLQSVASWSPHTATSGDTTYLDVTASSTAVAGSHSIEISRLASSQTIMSAAGVTSSTDTLSAAPTMSFTLMNTDGTTTNYTNANFAIASGDSLSTIASKISSYNYGTNSTGVSASTLFDGTNYRLILTPRDQGAGSRNSDGTTNTTRLTNLVMNMAWTGGQTWNTAATSGNTVAIGTTVAMSNASATVTALPANGDFQFDFNGTTYTNANVGIAAGDTLATIATKINSMNVTGLKASVVNDGQRNRLVMDGTSAITNFVANVGFTNVDGNNTASTLDTTVAANSSWGAFQSSVGQDAQLKVDGLTNIYSSSNTVTSVLPGITLSLKQVTAANTPVSVTVANDNTSLKTTLNSFTTAFNDVIKFIADNSGKGGTLEASALARSVVSQLRGQLNTATSSGDLSGNRLSPFSILAEIGLRTDQKTGQVSFDSTKLDSALNTNFTNLASLFTNTQTAVGTNNSAGLSYRLDTLLKSITNNTGSLGGSKQSLVDQLKSLDNTITREQAREDKVRAQLNKKFANLEQLVSSMNSQGNALTSALSKL
ncbi:MAG: flagellar filament capping protein FliD [Magnetococcales bacterium]|nr:flagellar filament capping protein FliD [Magnetococcales bacterium]